MANSVSSDGMSRVDRQSVDRLDDTLVDTVLSYLTFKDRVVFECLSKRIQRLIFNGQRELTIANWDDPDFPLKAMLMPVPVIDYTSAMAHKFELKSLDESYLTVILTKCNKVEKLTLSCYLRSADLVTIGTLCPHLKYLHIQTYGLSAQDLDSFGRLYGHRLKAIEFLPLNHGPIHSVQDIWPELLRHCANLAQVVSSAYSPVRVLDCVCSDDNQYLPNLERLTGYPGFRLGIVHSIVDRNNRLSPLEEWDQLRKLDSFCNKYQNTMKMVNVNNYITMDTRQLHSFTASLAKLTKLECLQLLLFAYNELGDHFNQFIGSGSTNWPKLKTFHIIIDVLNMNCDHFLKSFKGYQRLVDLRVDVKSIIFTSNVVVFSSLVSLKKLCISCLGINEHFFVDIGQHLPNLRELTIESESEISDKTLHELSKLKKLRKFSLRSYDSTNQIVAVMCSATNSITDSGVCQLVRGCHQIDDLFFAPLPAITSATVETLIACAKLSPKKVIEFKCKLSNSEDIEELSKLNMANLLDAIPPNLIINISHSL